MFIAICVFFHIGARIINVTQLTSIVVVRWQVELCKKLMPSSVCGQFMLLLSDFKHYWLKV